MISFTVYGTPQPQGSSRAFIPKGWTRAVITSDNPKLKSWRQELADAALRAFKKGPIERDVAVGVTAIFYFSKPKSAKKSTHSKTTKPDVDKLLRAALDGMTGIAYHDDAQVITASVGKYFSLPERTEIKVRVIEPES